jgi:general secretion pathway protein L
MQSIGLFIKDDQLVLVSLKQGLRATVLDGYEILPLGELKGEERDEALLYNLERFLRQHPGGRDNLFLALARDKVLMQAVYLPLAVEENLGTALSYEMDRLTPFPLDAIYFDYYILKRFPAKNQLYLMLIVVKKEVVDYYLNLLKKINLRPRGIELSATALFNLYQSGRTGADKPWAKDWLQQSTLLARLEKAIPQLFPQALKSAPDSSETAALEVLVSYLNGQLELSLVSDDMLYYVRSLPVAAPDRGSAKELPAPLYLSEIEQHIQHSMLNLPEHTEPQRSVRVLLTGMELDEELLRQQQATEGLDVSILRQGAVTVREPADQRRLPLLSIALGLALKGVRRVPLGINLIPVGQRLKKKRSKKKIAAALLSGLAVVLAGVLLIVNIMQTNARITELDAQLSELKAAAQSVEALQKEIEQTEKYNAEIKQVREGDPSKLKVLEELTRIIPEDSWLTDFEFNGDEKKTTISGYSASASKLIPLLDDSKLFSNVKFTSPITKGGGVKENFKIEMSPEAAKK